MLKIIIIIVVGVLSLIVQMLYFIKDDRTPNDAPKDKPYKLKWHVAGGVLHGWMYYVIADSYGYPWGCLMAALTWFFFDGVVNAYALNKEFFFIGTTALIDRAQQSTAKALRVDVRKLTAILKFSLILYAIWQILKQP